MNPVKANRVTHPSLYKGSSYACNAEGEANKLISPHETYCRLGLNKLDKQQSYALLFKNDVDSNKNRTIRNAVQFSLPTGDNLFKAQIE